VSRIENDRVIYRIFQKELYNGIPNVAMWRVIRRRLHLKTYKLSTVQGVPVIEVLRDQTNYVVIFALTVAKPTLRTTSYAVWSVEVPTSPQLMDSMSGRD
jgi:hypothetical protein